MAKLRAPQRRIPVGPSLREITGPELQLTAEQALGCRAVDLINVAEGARVAVSSALAMNLGELLMDAGGQQVMVSVPPFHDQVRAIAAAIADVEFDRPLW